MIVKSTFTRHIAYVDYNEEIMRRQESYFLEQEGAKWAVRYRKAGDKHTLCLADQKSDAEQIALAMRVFPDAKRAADELAGTALEGAGQSALVETFRRLKVQEGQAFFRQEVNSCVGSLGQMALALLAGVGVLAIIITLIQFLLKQ